jgi:hypothetical protein
VYYVLGAGKVRAIFARKHCCKKKKIQGNIVARKHCFT